MTREIVRQRPWAACVILLAGWFLYLLLCSPHWGYVDVPAIVGGLAWLWPFPILLSGLLDGRSPQRRCSLALYAVATAFVFAGLIGGSRPARVDIAGMMVGTFVIGPIHLVTAFVLEWLGQWVYDRFRELRGEEGTCAKCGYCIQHLTVARCPECGMPFDPRWLDSANRPRTFTRWPERLILAAVVIVVAMITFPFAYQTYALKIGIPRRAHTAAQRDWSRNEAIWYIDRSDPKWDMAWHMPRDPRTGLVVRPGISIGRRQAPALIRQDEIWRSAYNREVARLLAEHGSHPIQPHLLTYSRIKALIDSGDLHPLPPDGLRYGRVTIRLIGSTLHIDYGGSGSSRSSPVSNVEYVILPEKGDLLLLLVGDSSFSTYLPSGESLQSGFWPDIDQLIQTFE
jgi:hypothetical protein